MVEAGHARVARETRLAYVNGPDRKTLSRRYLRPFLDGMRSAGSSGPSGSTYGVEPPQAFSEQSHGRFPLTVQRPAFAHVATVATVALYDRLHAFILQHPHGEILGLHAARSAIGLAFVPLFRAISDLQRFSAAHSDLHLDRPGTLLPCLCPSHIRAIRPHNEIQENSIPFSGGVVGFRKSIRPACFAAPVSRSSGSDCSVFASKAGRCARLSLGCRSSGCAAQRHGGAMRIMTLRVIPSWQAYARQPSERGLRPWGLNCALGLLDAQPA